VTGYTALETEGEPEVALSLNTAQDDGKYEAIADLTLPQAKSLAAAIIAMVEYLEGARQTGSHLYR
jgi:hypothetical protein